MSKSYARPAVVVLVGLAMLATGTLCGSPAQAQTSPLLRQSGGETVGYVDQADGKAVVLVYPVELDDGADPQCIKVTVVSVSRDEAVDPAADGLFKVSFLHDAPVGPRIQVIVDPQAGGVRQGTYALRLRAMLDPGDRSDFMTLKVTHPAATLATITPTIIEQVVTFPWITEKTKAKVHVAENSSKSGLQPFSIGPEEAVKKDGVSQSVQVVADTSDYNAGGLPPGGSREVTLTVDGRPPLGTSTARLKLESPQLNSPVAFTVEIRRRLSLAYIAILALAGVALGVGARVLLATRIQRKEAETAGWRVVIDIWQQRASAKDAAFQGRLGVAAQALVDVLRAYDKPAEVEAAVTKANTAVQDARKKLDVDLKVQEERRKALAAQLQPHRKLPTAVGKEVSHLLSKLHDVARALADSDAAGAATLLEDLVSDVRGPVWTALRNWGTRMRDVESLLSGSIGGKRIPTSEQPAINAAITKSREAIDKVLGGEITDADVGTRLAAAQLSLAAFDETRSAMRSIPVSLNAAVSRLKPDRSTELEADATEFVSALEELGDGSDALPQWATVISKLGTLLDKAQRVILDAAPQAAKATVAGHFAAGNYFEAALEAAKPAGAEDPKLHGGSESDDESRSPIPPPWATPVAVLAGGVMVGGGVIASVPLKTPLEDAFEYRVRTLKELDAARLWQTVLLALAAVPIAYLLFAGTWVGTIANLAAVFLWGFAADITVNGVLAGAKAAQPTVPAAGAAAVAPAPAGGAAG